MVETTRSCGSHGGNTLACLETIGNRWGSPPPLHDLLDEVDGWRFKARQTLPSEPSRSFLTAMLSGEIRYVVA
jgi:hypothetical protein